MINQSSAAKQKASVTLTLPSWLVETFRAIDIVFSKIGEGASSTGEIISKKARLNFSFMNKVKNIGRNIPSFFKGHKKPVIVFAVLLVAAVSFFAIRSGNSSDSAVGGVTTSASSGNSLSINRKFEVPIKTKEGNETGEKLIVAVTSIEKTDNILIQNKPAKTKENKTFLIINMEIQNDTKKQLKVKPVDMVRLVGDDGRNYAPDVHNNEVNAEPVSIKKTKVGFVVEKSQNKFKLLIGEVRGNQETIELEF